MLAPKGAAVSYRLLILQNGTYYLGPTHGTTSDNAWQSFSDTLNASSFTRIVGEGPAQPDFTCTGAEIRFGYETGNTASGSAQTVSHIDNWAVSWRTERPCAEQLPQCPTGTTPTVVDGVTYCCGTDGGGPITQDTAQVCCTRTCPAGTVETTVGGVTFCCPTGAGSTQDPFCCRRR